MRMHTDSLLPLLASFLRIDQDWQEEWNASSAQYSMSVVNILNIQVLDNPTKFFNPFQFEITFECISPLKEGNLNEN